MKSWRWWQNEPARKPLCLIACLGNPGAEYERTRHNMGFLVGEELAKAAGLSLKKEERFGGKIAKNEEVILFYPLTYMNNSGVAVRKVADYFKVPMKNLLVILDDVALPFGACRLRQRGSSGGHNGLKSLEQHLKTQEFSRLRVGIGSPPRGVILTDYVLGRFTKEEEEELPLIVKKAAAEVAEWRTNETS